jgi:hypothetical protein
MLAMVTVNVVEPLMAPEAPVIVVVPTPAPVAFPEVLIVATVVSELLQKRPLLRLLVLPSLKVPVAIICNVAPSSIVCVCGPTAMLLKVGFTKKPRQPRLNAKIASTAKAPARRSFCLVDDIVVVTPWGTCLT